jgi:hypothetical protein
MKSGAWTTAVRRALPYRCSQKQFETATFDYVFQHEEGLRRST